MRCAVTFLPFLFFFLFLCSHDPRSRLLRSFLFFPRNPCSLVLSFSSSAFLVLQSADSNPRSAEIARLVATGLTPRQAALSLLVAGPGAAERPGQAAEATARIAGLEAVGFPEARVLGALVRFNMDAQAAAEACLQSSDVPL